jgi:phosphoketolase
VNARSGGTGPEGSRGSSHGTTTTPFDLTVRDRASRYHLVMDAINNARRLPAAATDLKS